MRACPALVLDTGTWRWDRAGGDRGDPGAADPLAEQTLTGRLMSASGTLSHHSPTAAEAIAEFAAAYAPFVEELAGLRPPDGAVIDGHTHLGSDEDGQTLSPEALIGFLDQAARGARACAFAFHDPDRSPGYRRPNDRVLAWAADSGGRIVPYCRLDPADDPVGEARRCLARGARGIKLHPRAQAFGFGDAAAEAIFAVAQDAVPILVHAGRGMPRMDPLADLASRFPDVTPSSHTPPLPIRACSRTGSRIIRTSSTTRPASRRWMSSSCSHEFPPRGSSLPPTSRTAGPSAACTPRCAWRHSRVSPQANAHSSPARRWPPRSMAGRWRQLDRRAWTGCGRSTARCNVRAPTC